MKTEFPKSATTKKPVRKRAVRMLKISAKKIPYPKTSDRGFFKNTKIMASAKRLEIIYSTQVRHTAVVADWRAAWVRHALRQAGSNLVGVIVENVVRTADQAEIVAYTVAQLHVDENFSANLLLCAALVYS
jgi:adenylate kinase family enzyme